ncbi:unnamed protein product [Meloidogyne enterolobii]|uniref:Uncharacterized protein n=1 Tax=Meloidogyne enterolobii TaxID=390850 RepID=A0ACB1ALN5_MELEN
MEKCLVGGKVNYVLDELLSTERTYVRELAEIIHHYILPLEALEFTSNNGTANSHNILPGQSNILFGNIRDLVKNFFVKEGESGTFLGDSRA